MKKKIHKYSAGWNNIKIKRVFEIITVLCIICPVAGVLKQIYSE